MSPRPSVRELVELLASPAGRKGGAVRSRRDEVVLDRYGEPLFRIQRQRKAFVLMLPIDSTPVTMLEEISSRVAEILQSATVQHTEQTGIIARKRKGLPRRRSLAAAAALSESK